MTIVNGASEVIEGVTATSETSNDGYNPMRDTVLGGNRRLYETQRDVLATVAEVGTTVLNVVSAVKGPMCFAAGTLIKTEAGSKPIEEIIVGDYVYASDPETAESGYKKVLQTFENEAYETVKVTYEDETITTTPSHPFYVPDKGWIEAIDLRAGDILVTCNGKYVVVEKVQHEILESPIKVYNFEVEDYHTYYVSNSRDCDESILVHNSCNHNSAWNAERRKYWRKTAKTVEPGKNYGSFTATADNINRMRKGLAPIGWDNKSVQLHHWSGIANDFYNYSPVSRTLHQFLHHPW